MCYIRLGGPIFKAHPVSSKIFALSIKKNILNFCFFNFSHKNVNLMLTVGVVKHVLTKIVNVKVIIDGMVPIVLVSYFLVTTLTF